MKVDELLYGTTNKSKLRIMHDKMTDSGVCILGLSDVHADMYSIEESGNTLMENACIKAWRYYKICNMPVFSVDTGLYLENVEKSDQPGINVRTVNNRWLDDNEMINYYTGLADKYGGKIVAKYQNAVCLIIDESNVYAAMTEDMDSDKFLITSKVVRELREGFPLDSISVNLTGATTYRWVDGVIKFLKEALKDERVV